MTILNMKDFKYKATYIHCSRFIERYCHNRLKDTDNLKKSTIRDYKSKFRKLIVNFYAEYKLEDINSDILLKHIESPNFNKRNMHVLFDFILFLIEEDITHDISLKRLHYIKNRIVIYIKPSEIKFILLYKKFDELIENGFFEDMTSSKYQLLFIRPNRDLYNSKDAYDYICNYIHYLKIDSGNTIKSTISRCRALLKCSHLIFGKYSPHSISYNEFKFNMLANESKLMNQNILELIKLLKYSHSYLPFKDDKMNEFATILEYFAKMTNKKKLIEILNSKKMENYFFISHKNIKRKSNSLYYLYYLNIENKELKFAFESFLQSSQQIGLALNEISSNFEDSLIGLEVKSISDLNLNSYIHQVKFFSSIDEKKRKHGSLITNFYNHIAMNYNPKIFKNDGFDSSILQRADISAKIINGYELISLNSFDPIPVYDKWLLYFGEISNSNSSITTSSVFKMDFSLITNTVYRYWCKHYIWRDTSSMSTKKRNMSDIKFFLNYIDKIKRREILTIFTGSTPSEDFVINDVIAYKHYVYSKYTNNRTRSSYIYIARLLLNHISEYGIYEVDSSYKHHLTHTLSSDYNNAVAIPDSELKLLSTLMNKNSSKSVLNTLYYAIFYIALETEFRPSQIVRLTHRCVNETAKPNEFIIKSKSKRSPESLLEQAITIYVKRQIDEIIALTNEYRNSCHVEKLKQYLFIVPTVRHNIYKLIRIDDFNSYLQKCCNEVGIHSYSISNLRDTHMTKAEEYAIRNSISDIEQSVLTGHISPSTTSRFYVDSRLTELLEAVHGIIIGNVNVSGEIVKEINPSINNNEHLVEDGCGYCNLKTCKENTMLGCLVCSDFVTTISRLPYFEERIKMIDNKLKKSRFSHDKEDLSNIKILLVAYKKEIIKLMED